MPQYRDPDNQNQHPGNWRPTPAPSLGGLLGFTPTPALSPYPGVAPAPVVPANRQSPYAPPPVQRAAPAAPRPVGGGDWAPSGGNGYSGPAAGGGGPLGDGYPVNATPALGQDPAYLAFLRALGIEKNDLTQSAATRMSVIDNEIARRLADIAQAGVYSREGIAGNFESRGVLHSSAREIARARELADEGRQTGALQGAADDQKRLIREEYDRRIAEANRRIAEQSLTSAGNIYQ